MALIYTKTITNHVSKAYFVKNHCQTDICEITCVPPLGLACVVERTTSNKMFFFKIVFKFGMGVLWNLLFNIHIRQLSLRVFDVIVSAV